ncbi:MAG: tagaturonate reductase [Thermoguttaceae bacterium]
MPRLSRALLRQGLPRADGITGGRLDELPETIVQFGEGAFLRGFADWMVDIANEKGLMHAGIVVVPPVRDAMADPIEAQDGLYTLVLRGMVNSKGIEERRIVSSIRRVIRPHSQWNELVACFRSRPLRVVISNTTEAGICYVDEPYWPEQCPASFPAKVTSLLYERFQAAEGAAAQGLIFLPCELIDRNGDQLSAAVLQHAEVWKLAPAFSRWVREANYFLNTLVDRIVTGYPYDDAKRLARELGYEDALLDAAESFHLWVIEGPRRLIGELPFHEAKLNVVWTDDLQPYRTRKVRILNGAHTAGALAALPAGIDTVYEMMGDPVFAGFLRKAIFDEILPTVPLDDAEKHEYAEAVFQRFRNQHLRHELLSIALNSVAKWRTRVLPSLLDSLRCTGRLPQALAFSLATLACFYRGERSGGASYPLRDDPAVLAFFDSAWAVHRADGSIDNLTTSLLAARTLWDVDLNQVPGLGAAVAAGIEAILSHGMCPAVAAIVNEEAS